MSINIYKMLTEKEYLESCNESVVKTMIKTLEEPLTSVDIKMKIDILKTVCSLIKATENKHVTTSDDSNIID